MEASFVDFRKKSAEIIRALDRNEKITIFYRGKPKAVMLPIARQGKKNAIKAKDDPTFGMWAERDDMKDVAKYVRKLRRGRFSDL